MPLPKSALRIADLGYFSLPDFAQMNSSGVYWLTRVKSQCVVYDQKENKYDLVEFINQNCDIIDQPIFLGVKDKVPCRLLAARVPDDVSNERRRKIRLNARKKGRTPSKRQLALADWTVLATNAEEDKMDIKSAMVMIRVRWQIELLFKLWKSEGQINSWRSEKPWRILCELYAKLIAMVIQHWIFLIGFWEHTNRSFTKASRTIRHHAMNLAIAFSERNIEHLIKALEIIERCLSFGCKIYKRKTKPNTYQILSVTS